MNTIEIRASSIAGKGVFAARTIQKDESIFKIKGPTITFPSPPEGRLGPDWLNVGALAWKIAEHGSPWVYLNHCCAANAGTRDGKHLVAMRAIQAGEEITLDYSTVESATNWHLRCDCKTPDCRRTIRGIHSLSPELFQKYQPYLQPFLRTEYENQRVTVGEGRIGIFARRAYRKGQKLFSVEGPTIKYTKAPKTDIGYRWLGIRKNTWLIPYRSNPWWSLRHSCDPNVGISGERDVVSLRTIRAGEEIRIDDSITEAQPGWNVKCDCGAKLCRGIVRSVQYLPEEIFEKYLPYVPAFIQEAYRSECVVK
jgi:hypothetical protein